MATTSNVQAPAAPSSLEPAEADRLYAFANRAWARRGARQDSPAETTQLVQVLVRLGLGAVAAEVADSLTDDKENTEQLAALRRALPAGEGRQSWGPHRRRFEANLAAWASRGGAAPLVAEAWANERRVYELFRDRAGHDQVRGRAVDESTVWIPLLGPHAQLAAAAPLPNDISTYMPGPYLFEGLDLGWYFDRIWRRTQDTFWGYSSALYVLEPDSALLAVAFHLHDWQDLLADERVFLFTGPEASAQFATLLRSNANLALPRQIYHLSGHRPAPQPRGLDVVKAELESRSIRVATSAASLADLYRGRDLAWWARRFAAALAGEAPPLRVLGVVSTHTSFLQYAMRDARQAVRRLGHEFRILTEQTPYERPGYDSYQQAIAEFEPDLFLMIDHLRAEFSQVIPANLPVLTWDQDALPHVFTPVNLAGMSPLDVVVGLPKIGCLARMGADPRQFLATVMPTDPDRWRGTALASADLAAHAADFSYVSHGSATPEEMLRAELAQCQDETLRHLMVTMHDTLVRGVPPETAPTGRGVRDIYAEAERRAGVRVNDRGLRERLFGWQLWRLWDRRFRHEILGWVARYAQARGRTLRLYGDGWERHPQLARFACGPASNGAELLAIYRATAINLQIMPAGFLHQRALDGLAGGAFVMTPALDSDACLPGLRDLASAIAVHGWRSCAELQAHGGEERVRQFARLQAAIGFDADEDEEAFHHLRIYAGWPYPTEIFPDFADITFTNETSFARLADHYLQAPAERAMIAARMHEQVTRRLSYAAVFTEFLQFVAEYYRQRAAAEAGEGEHG